MMKALLTLALLLPAIATASPPTHGVEITPFAGYIFGGQFEADEEGNSTGADIDIDIDDAASFGLIVNWPAEANTEWEVYLSRQSTSLQTDGLFSATEAPPGDLNITYLQVGGTYYGQGERARPYLAATVGASRFEPDDSSFDAETFFSFGIGAGYKIAPTSRLGLRLEGRVLGSVVDSDEAVFCTSGPAASGCLIGVSGNMVWQWEVLAGLIFRL